MTKVIKRDGRIVDFDRNKIYNAIDKAMKFGSGIVKPHIAFEISNQIESEFSNQSSVSIADIESAVFEALVQNREILTARAYEGYRKVREYQREVENSTDQTLDELLDGTSDYWLHENSNKNPVLVTTQRDYMAGIMSEDQSKRKLLPPDVIQAHEDGIIHFHDIDYFA